MIDFPLTRISIDGFKSIKELKDFPLEPLNVLIGANGAGKSNFVDFFRMLNAMANKRLQEFVRKNGGADGFFFNGPKETQQISASLFFKEIRTSPPSDSVELPSEPKLNLDSNDRPFESNEYWFCLEPTVVSEMLITEGGLASLVGAVTEPESEMLGDRFEGAPPYRARTKKYLGRLLSQVTLYHFHDTSNLSQMRREQPKYNYHVLSPNGANIAAYLLSLFSSAPKAYERIRETIQIVAPFFDDFFLEPFTKGDEEKVRLQWRQKGSAFPFQPYHFSDGTLRFICLTAALLQPDPPPLMIVDEPELGLHPFALDVLASLIYEISERAQLILSTQSVTLLNHFEPEEVIVVDREAGASRFRRLESEPLKLWLEDYTLGELWQKNVLDGGPTYE